MHLSNIAGKLGGGVSKVVQALLKHQNLSNLNSDLWFFGSKKIINEVANDTNVKSRKINALGKNIFKLPFFLSKIKESNYDIIHQHGIFLPISLFSILRNKNTKLVISPHGYLEPEKLKVSKLKKNIVLWLFEKRNLKYADCLVACSIQEAEALRDFGLKQPIAILPNGVNNEFIQTPYIENSVQTFREKHLLSNNKKILLFLSRIHPFKGVDVFIKSIYAKREDFRKNDWIFLIAGTNEKNYETVLKKYVFNKKIDDIVKFIGPLYGDEKIAAYDASSCFVLPSKGENFGIVIIEALSRGVPVISTKSTPWSDLEKYNCGWWIDRSENSFNKILKNLFLIDKETLSNMGLNGKKLINEKYIWPKISEESVNIYKWVVNDFEKDFKNGFRLFKDT